MRAGDPFLVLRMAAEGSEVAIVPKTARALIHMHRSELDGWRLEQMKRAIPILINALDTSQVRAQLDAEGLRLHVIRRRT